MKEIGYEQHLFDGAEREQLAAARWNNVLEFVDWIARRCGGQVTSEGAVFESPKQSVLQVAQTVSLIASLAQRGDAQDVVTLATLHAAKGLEWPHVWLASVVEGLLPFRGGDGDEMTAQRLEEERRLMYVGITRARSTLALGVLRRRKHGREKVTARPSRFVAEMKLDEARAKEDPRDRLRKLREQLAARPQGVDAS
jgi:ATP-dependent DNA helicase Rep